MDEISEFLLFTVTDGGHFGFYALKNFARLFIRGVGAYFFYKYLKLPKTTVIPYLQKVVTNHGFGPNYKLISTILTNTAVFFMMSYK